MLMLIATQARRHRNLKKIIKNPNRLALFTIENNAQP